MKGVIISKTLETWKQIEEYSKTGWLYRGQGKVCRPRPHPPATDDWDLKTSLERCCDRQDISLKKRTAFEDELFREFRRAYHHYAQCVPERNSVMEWFSLMQHHGAPTRLLDFTYSIYVAAYFALEEAESDCAVWAVDGQWASKDSVRRLRKAGKSDTDVLLKNIQENHESIIQRLFFQPPYVKLVCPLNPFRLGERLRAQKGIFLVPGDVRAPFMDNLECLSGYGDPAHLIQLIIPLKLRTDFLRHLYEMNISRTSLFPGLDGYATSLTIYHWSFERFRA